MSTIRILFYTDYTEMTDNSCSDFGLSELKKLIILKTAPLCGAFTVQISSIDRHRDLANGAPSNGANKLTRELLDQFDELWVFGFLQTNKLSKPKNELGDDEVFELRRWMDAGGGVFVTGDHANPDPRLDLSDERNQDPQTFLNLGRALGHRIPRAGQLRVWKGPPTALVNVELEKRDNINTLVGRSGTDLDKADHLQTDDKAQELILNESSKPHRLFWWYLDKDDCTVAIRKFPDHMHEGRLQVPTFLNGDWTAPRPLPQVVASGRDKRPFIKERIYPLVIAYDGSIIREPAAKVGRIVADSSFHHYVNINLVGFKRDLCGNPLPFSDLDQVAQYFANLSLWLAPQNLRDIIKAELMILLAAHPQILEIKGNDINSLGRTALGILGQGAGLINLRQIFEFSPFDSRPRLIDIFLSLILLGQGGPFELDKEKQAEFLGCFIQLIHETFEIEELINLKSLMEQTAKLDVLEGQLRSIFEVSTNPISQFLNDGKEGIEALLRACDLTDTPLG